MSMNLSPPPSDPGSPYPVVRLLPRAGAQAIRHGFPWVYTNELVMDRRTKGLAPGSFAVLEDANRAPMGVVTVNPVSKIGARMMSRDADTIIDEDWIAIRLRAALALRERLFGDPFYRLVHAEADGLPGVVIDRFGDTAVVQPNAAWSEAMIGPLVSALVAVTRVTCVIKNATGRARTLEGLNEETTVVLGAAPAEPIAVPMNGAVFMADVMGGQKTGLFFDQRPNHAFAAGLARGGRVLDMFCHVGGFGLTALAAGAAHAVLVDGSAPALDLARRGAVAMGAETRVTCRKGDAFDTLAALASENEVFDLVVCDPPAFAPSKKALDPGLRAYERTARLAAPLVRPGGTLMLCSCSHAVDLAAFRSACARGIGKAGREGAIVYTGFAGPDHPVLPQLAESGYLKALAFRL